VLASPQARNADIPILYARCHSRHTTGRGCGKPGGLRAPVKAHARPPPDPTPNCTPDRTPIGQRSLGNPRFYAYAQRVPGVRVRSRIRSRRGSWGRTRHAATNWSQPRFGSLDHGYLPTQRPQGAYPGLVTMRFLRPHPGVGGGAPEPHPQYQYRPARPSSMYRRAHAISSSFTAARPIVTPPLTDMSTLDYRQAVWRTALQNRTVEAYVQNGLVTVVNNGTASALVVPVLHAAAHQRAAGHLAVAQQPGQPAARGDRSDRRWRPARAASAPCRRSPARRPPVTRLPPIPSP
jgi:hypothetical protein